MAEIEKAFVTLEEVAKYLIESTSTIPDWCQRRKIPHYKRSKRLQFDLEDIKKSDRENNYRGIINDDSKDD